MGPAVLNQTLAVRLLLFLVLPLVLWWGLELLVPLSMLLTVALFFPFAGHPDVFALAPWTYIVNGAFVALIAIATVVIGRRLSVWANIGIFFGIAVIGSLTTHFGLELLGFPFQGDSP
jgi:hypothetical protein